MYLSIIAEVCLCKLHICSRKVKCLFTWYSIRPKISMETFFFNYFLFHMVYKMFQGYVHKDIHNFHKFISVFEESNNWECSCSQLDRMLVHCRVERDKEIMTAPGARFSKVPRLFGRISGDIILFVSSKRRCPEARNFADILIFISYTTYEKISFTE